MTFLDGNAAAGELRDIFTADLTTAVGRCAGCGQVGPLAEAHVYAQSPGLVVRCSGCEGVLLRLVKAPGRAWLDLKGLSYLQLPAG